MLGLPGIEWVISEDHGVGRLVGSELSGALQAAGIWHSAGWAKQGSDSAVCRMHTGLRAFDRKQRCAVYSVSRMSGSSLSIVAQKNRVRLLRPISDGVVRPARTTGSRSAVRRFSNHPGTGGAAHRVPHMRVGEARAAGLPGGQPGLFPHGAFPDIGV